MLIFVPAPRDAFDVERYLLGKEGSLTGISARNRPSVYLFTGAQTVEEGDRVLQAREQRIVICTAVAEAGLTFGDCTLVLSSGVCKLQVVDDQTRRPQLVWTKASSQQLRQQAGRARRRRTSGFGSRVPRCRPPWPPTRTMLGCVYHSAWLFDCIVHDGIS